MKTDEKTLTDEQRALLEHECAADPASVKHASITAALRTIDAQREEIDRAWAALNMTPEDRAKNDDPDVATLADAIAVSLQYERDQRDAQREEIAQSDENTDHLRDRIAALEAENAALREVERIASASVEWITPLSLQRALRDAVAKVDALRKEGK